MNPSHCGTKCAAHYVLTLDPGEEFTITVRLYFELEAPKTDPFGPDFDEIFQDRHKEADMFYEEVSKLYISIIQIFVFFSGHLTDNVEMKKW